MFFLDQGWRVGLLVYQNYEGNKSYSMYLLEGDEVLKRPLRKVDFRGARKANFKGRSKYPVGIALKKLKGRAKGTVLKELKRIRASLPDC